MSNSNTQHYINNNWTSSPTLSFFDLSIIRGFGVFDFLRTYDQKPFMLDEHIDRLFNSARVLGITVPKTKSQIRKIVLEGIEKNALLDYNIRIVVTGGVSTDGLSVGASSLAVLFTEAIDYPKSYYTKGIAVVTESYERVYPEAKSLNYLKAVRALSMAKPKKAIEVVYTDPMGRILEGTTSNFFAVVNGRLVTPKQNILAGITRNLVIEIARKLKIEVLETDILYDQISLFDEAFITASNKEVMPVVKIDRVEIGNGKVGPNTRKVMKKYKELI